MLQALVTLVFSVIALGAATLIGRFLRQDWDAVRAAFGLGQPNADFTPLPPRYRVNSRRATYVRMEAAPLRHAA